MKNPVVAANIAGPTELVADGKTGYLIPLGKFEDAASAVAELVISPALRKEMGMNGYHRVIKEFTIDNYIQGVEKIFKEIQGQQMKILIATPDFPLWDGGISTVSFEVAMGLHRIGYDISVLTPLQNPSDINFDSTLPFKIFRIKNIKDHYLKTYYHIMKMNQLIKKYKFDLIMAQSWYPSGIAAVNVAKRHKVKMTVTVHGNEILNLRFASNFWLRKMKKVFDEADKIFCVSNYTHQKLKQRLQNVSNINKNTAIVYNGV